MMLKKIIFFIITLFLLTSCSESFQKLPEKNRSDEYLLEQIVPDSKVQYWQVDFVNGFRPNKKFAKGDMHLSKQISLPENQNFGDLFAGCQPVSCNYRILYIQDNKWEFVQNKEELKSFIGKIDNEYEAFLIARINDYEIDLNSNGNGFLKTDFGYKLKVMIYETCPETKQSFVVTVDENGKLDKLKDLGYYLKRKNCIVY